MPINGTNAGEVIGTTAGNDIVNALGGDDTVNYAGGFDSVDGGSGDDTMSFAAASAAVSVDLVDGFDLYDAYIKSGDQWVGIANLTNVEDLTGSSYDDYLAGVNGSVLDGGGGNDRLVMRGSGEAIGGAGTDTLVLGSVPTTSGLMVMIQQGHGAAGIPGTHIEFSGIEVFEGTSYGDVFIDITSDQSLTVKGGHGNDGFAQSGAMDIFDGGTGSDTVSFYNTGAAVWVDLEYAGEEAWTRDGTDLSSGAWRVVADLISVENVVGSAYNDEIRGNAQQNRFQYIEGFDVMDGRGGADTVDFGSFDSAVWVDLEYAGSEAWTRDSQDLLSGTYREIADLTSIENVVATFGSDAILGSAASNNVTFRGGSPSLPQRDSYDGRGGQDSADFSEFEKSVWIDLSEGTGKVWTNMTNAWDKANTWSIAVDLANVEHAGGSAYRDWIRGDATSNFLDGNGGDDTFVLSGGLDIYFGDEGRDMLDLSSMGGSAVWVDLQYADGAHVWTRDNAGLASGDWRQLGYVVEVEDFVTTAGDDAVWGNDADNSFVYVEGFDELDGRSGTDTVDFGSFDYAVWIDLEFAGSEAWTRDGADLSSGSWRKIASLTDIEEVRSTAFNDTFYGTDAVGETFVYIGGYDTAYGGGGTAKDVLDFSEFNAAVWVELNVPGVDAWTRDGEDLDSGSWRPIVNAYGFERVTGTAFDDHFGASSSANIFRGGAGWDEVFVKGSKDDYVVTKLASGVYTVLEQGNGTNFDGLYDVEKLVFNDGQMLLVDIIL